MVKNKLLLFITILSVFLFSCIKYDETDTSIDKRPKLKLSFTIDKTSGESPLSITASNTSENAIYFMWNFGDGTYSNEQTVTHTYSNDSYEKDKTYNLILTAYGADSIVTRRDTVITVNKIKYPFGEVKDVEGNVYKTIQIGTQVWMVEDLKVSKFNDNTSIWYVNTATNWNNATGPAYCWYNSIHNESALYNFYVVDSASNGGKSICPEGWHIPTKQDWQTLSDYMKNYTGRFYFYDFCSEGKRDKGGAYVNGASWWSSDFNFYFRAGYGIDETQSKNLGLSIRCVKN
jgi:uncharacterized protein (TIGR02145 family)